MSSKASVFPQYFACLSATLGAFALGTVLGWNSSASVMIQENLGASATDTSWVGSVMCLGAATVMLPLSFFLDYFGRKLVMMFLVFPFIGGWVMLAFVDSIPLYCVGRYITGFCGGAFCVAVPIFIGETAEPRARGPLGACFQFLLVIGILFSYCTGGYVDIMWMSLLAIVPLIVFFVIFLFIPETPYHRIMKGKSEQAAKSLQWYRGKDFDTSAELKEIEKFVKESQESNKSFVEKFSTKAAKKSLFIGLGLMLAQQLSGINAVIFHALSIFKQAGSSLEPILCQIIIGVVQLVATLVAVLTIEKAGRKLLLTISCIAMGGCLIVLGVYFSFLDSGSGAVDDIGWLPVLVLCLYMVAFSIGAGPVPWLMLGELFPTEIKGMACSICSFLNWMLAFVVPQVFPFMVEGIGNNVSFWIFGGINFAGAAFIIFVCIETKGKTLEEIQGILEG